MLKKVKFLYCICFFCVSLVPLVGMFFTENSENAEKRILAEFPSIVNEDSINVEWLSEAGEYFQDHFAFRNELVTANALIYGKLFQVSTASSVVQGENGWLYYKDSLEDYQGINLLSERSLYNIAHSLQLLQENLAQRNVEFVFTIAPNKNSLYGENMPYYYEYKVSAENNLSRLENILESEQINYVDLYEVLKNQDEVMYHQRDSHWNNKGAALAADVIMTQLGKEHISYEDETYEIRTDFVGDLDEMLYPLAVTPEDEIYYSRPTTFAYVGDVNSNFDPKITTVNPIKNGSIVMYRDSFANTLLPFIADAYANAYFSRGVPYQIEDVVTQQADTVVIERSERFLPDMAQNPPVLEGTLINLSGEPEGVASEGASNIEVSRYGMLYRITGKIQGNYIEEETKIYLRMNRKNVYEAFPMDLLVEDVVYDSGFCLYLAEDKWIEGNNLLEIIVETDGKQSIIYQSMIRR